MGSGWACGWVTGLGYDRRPMQFNWDIAWESRHCQQCGTQRTYSHAAFADAGTARIRDIRFAALQPFSPKRSFALPQRTPGQTVRTPHDSRRMDCQFLPELPVICSAQRQPESGWPTQLTCSLGRTGSNRTWERRLTTQTEPLLWYIAERAFGVI